MALAHNRRLELARLAVQESEEQRQITRSHYLPVIKNESALLHITDLEGVIVPAGELSHGTAAGLIPSETARIGQGAATSYSSGTSLDQPLTQLFRIHAAVKAAGADVNKAKIQLADNENKVAEEVHQLYYSYLIEQLQGSTAEDNVQASAVIEKENVQGVEQGRLLTDAELGSRADLLDKKRAILLSNLNLSHLTLQLDDLLGLSLGTKLDLDPDAIGVEPTLPPRDKAIAAVLERSPTVLAARQNVEKAKAGVDVSRDAYIPNVTAIARYSYQSGLPFLAHNFGTFGASLTYDLFDGGARRARLHDARLKYTEAQTQLTQAENDVRIQMADAYDKLEQLRELVNVSELALETRKESYRIKVEREQTKAELASGVATAHAAMSFAKLNVLTSKLNLYLAGNHIKRLLGEMPR